MRDVLDTIAIIVWLLSLPIIITGIVFVCRKKWRKMGLKTLCVGALLFVGAPIVGVAVQKDKPDQVVHNNEVVTPSSTPSINVATQDESMAQALVENTDKQNTPTQDNKSDKNDSLGSAEWMLLIILTLFSCSTLYHYWRYKRKKHFEQQVTVQRSILFPHIRPSSDFSYVAEMLPALDAHQYDYCLAHNEKLLGVQEYANFVVRRKIKNIEQMVVIARGRLLVTDQAIVFESPEKNERTTWKQIKLVKITYEGCQVYRRSGVPWNYEFAATPRFVAVVRTLEKSNEF
ncbi:MULTISPECIES: hypothetical protein [unclassified Bartonella]|uniref:hypothetical protein n=1 Tax=unclassified Bartonella TaxID=2645622 RepID=UPI0035D1306D